MTTKTITHANLIRCMIDKTRSKVTGQNRWGANHVNAWIAPRGLEVIGPMIQAAAVYADEHSARYGSKIGDDMVLGAEWESIVRACSGLLNGELGRFDAGTLDGLLRDMLELEGFSRDD